ncbi:hypothetical protein HNY73_021981 [Argiope bruennichi]|uniref:Uncharacterized protein n=1 Tax=Argiope bruennichi TaxID=94029 RepID=A0A8T0E0G0_ARGBR|nr:hypothetical protein HNY73_021981 [Argiope bruennichi]
MAAYYPLFDDEMTEGRIGPPGIGFKLTDNGDYDMEKKKLKRVDEPVEISDAATKSYVGFFFPKGIPLKHLPNPQDKNDAVTKQYVDKKTKINDKKPDNMLTRDHDGLYVPKTSTFLATNKEQQIEFDHEGTLIEFNVFSSTLLTNELQLTTDMLMKITLFLKTG